MSENKKYDSELIGWADDPFFIDGQLVSWTLKLKDNELKDILDNYISTRDPKTGHGGNARIKLFMSKNGKACASVYNWNSETALERQAKAVEAKKAAAPAAAASEEDDLPF
jgi:hypothetical protein